MRATFHYAGAVDEVIDANPKAASVFSDVRAHAGERRRHRRGVEARCGTDDWRDILVVRNKRRTTGKTGGS
ncbi:MAG: hypothetical protein ACREB8_02290 [Pseudolabrys sp.]